VRYRQNALERRSQVSPTDSNNSTFLARVFHAAIACPGFCHSCRSNTMSRAVAAPTPRAPPVTMATLSFERSIIFSLIPDMSLLGASRTTVRNIPPARPRGRSFASQSGPCGRIILLSICYQFTRFTLVACRCQEVSTPRHDRPEGRGGFRTSGRSEIGALCASALRS
jgi:hypothetical protein